MCVPTAGIKWLERFAISAPIQTLGKMCPPSAHFVFLKDVSTPEFWVEKVKKNNNKKVTFFFPVRPPSFKKKRETGIEMKRIDEGSADNFSFLLLLFGLLLLVKVLDN